MQFIECCTVLTCSVVSNSLRPHDYSLVGTSVDGDSPGKNTGVGCHALLPRIFPTQRLNPGLLNCKQILYQLSHLEENCRLCGQVKPLGENEI